MQPRKDYRAEITVQFSGYWRWISWNVEKVLNWRRNHCLSHVFSKQCEWVLYQKEVSPSKGDWVVWYSGLIFYLCVCVCVVGELFEDNIRLWIFVCMRLISRSRILINKDKALALFCELTPAVLQVRWDCHRIFSLCTKRTLKRLRKTCSWPGGAWAQDSGWLLGNLMKWQNKIGSQIEASVNTVLAQHPEAGWQKEHAPWS